MDRPGGQDLRGREVTITGRLASMSRADAIQAILAAGGRHVAIPSPATRFLILGGDFSRR